MRKSAKATIWSVFDRVGNQAISFLIGIVLARILSPSDYGIIGLSSIFIAFSNVFIECGFSNALIRKIDCNQADLSTAFVFNVFMGVLLYFILYSAAPLISDFFDSTLLINVLRIVGLTLLLNSFCIVQNAVLTTKLDIKPQTVINLCAQIPSGIIAIILAYYGYGVYALAIQAVGASLIKTILLWVYAKWKPSLIFNKDSFRYLWKFGFNLIIVHFIGTFFNKIYSFIIGKYVGKTDLGYYSKAESLSSQPDSIMTGVIQKVAVPIFSKYQDNLSLLLEKYRYCIKMIMCMMCFITACLVTIAHPLIIYIWTSKWETTVSLFQLLLISVLLSPVGTLNLLLLQVLNRTDYTLKLEFIKKPICLIVIVLLVRFGLYGIILAAIINSFFGVLINMQSSQRFIKYSYRMQFVDIFKYLIIGCISALVGLYSIKVCESLLLQIFWGFSTSSLSYLILLFLTKDVFFRNTLYSIKARLKTSK